MNTCANCPEKEKCKIGYGDCVLLDVEFLQAMNANWLDGANRTGRVVNDWRAIERTLENVRKYFEKLSRHADQAKCAGTLAVAQAHLAAVACNANIL